MSYRLSIVEVENKHLKPSTSRAAKREEAMEKFNKLWSENSHQFDPLRNCIEIERIQLTAKLIERYMPNLTEKKAGDKPTKAVMLLHKTLPRSQLAERE